MTIPRHRNIQIHSEAFNEREIWHKLVVKVILWKTQVAKNEILTFTDKITLSEWKIYKRKMVKINETGGKIKILATLKDTWQKIQNNNGFVEE